MDGDKTHALETLLASEDGPSPVLLRGRSLVIPGLALLGVGPTPLSTSPGG